MNRRGRRNRDAFWAQKVGAARTPVDRAVVEFDRLRAAVDDLPTADRDKAWEQVQKGLEKLRQSVTDGEFTSAVHTGSANRSTPYA